MLCGMMFNNDEQYDYILCNALHFSYADLSEFSLYKV